MNEVESEEQELRNSLGEPSKGTPEFDVMCNRIGRIRSVANPNMAIMRVVRDKYEEFGERFAATPTEVLKEWGAQVGPTRTVDALYRIRERVSDSEYEDYAVIGYPIVIAEHPSRLAS